MNIEQQVTSLELSKKLKEAGYKQEGLWYWVKSENEEWLPRGQYGLVTNNEVDRRNWICFVAPTCAELFNELVNKIKDNWDIWWNDGWHCQTYKGTENLKSDIYPIVFEGDKNVTTCLAKMYLYLKKEELL